jgi:hypothetical protein
MSKRSAVLTGDIIRYRRKRRHRYDVDIEKTDITSYANSDVMVAGEAVKPVAQFHPSLESSVGFPLLL